MSGDTIRYPKCDASGKCQYTSKRVAMRCARRNSNGRRMRAYVCPDCRRWHLTSEAVPEAKRLSD